MKKVIVFAFVFLALIYSCSEDFLETVPLGRLSENVFYTEKGVNALLIGAYAMLDGAGAGGWGGDYAWAGAVTNWVWGSVASDDAYKGTTVSDQIPINPIEKWEVITTNEYVNSKWVANYDGIARANDVLKVLAKSSGISEAKTTQFKAEAMFLRAWFHFELRRIYRAIPYITEDVEDPTKVPNDVEVWPMIEADMQFAIDNLPEPEDQTDVGRPTKYAAMAVMARIHLMQHDYTAAALLLDVIINSGKYSLMPNFHDNYKIETNNNAESIFEIQYSVNDGINESFSAGYGDCLNFPQGNELMTTCCGFHQPSQSLVNAFKVDASGLPLLDTYNDTDLKNDQGVGSIETFVPFTDVVDPRLDWTVGRRGIQYLDWGPMRGNDWIRSQINGGPYLPIKNMYYQTEQGILSTTTGWATGVNANNYRAYRYAHILLWRAECYVEANDLPSALALVNEVRTRARTGSRVMGLCTTYELPSGGTFAVDYGQEAANYDCQDYLSFPDQAYARKAVQMELRLEFGMEGHRFFDLRRWGIIAETLQNFALADTRLRGFMTDAQFTSPKDDYWPLPQAAIDEQGSDILTQDPNY